MTKISGIRAVLAVKGAMTDQGLPRRSTLNGAEIRGWIEPNRMGSTGFSIRKLSDGNILWHVVLSGKPHLEYREYREVNDDDTIDLHEPTNTERLFPALRQVFEGLGMDVVKTELCGFQTHWDDDVSYNVITKIPEWLDTINNQHERAQFDPSLVTCRMSDHPQAPIRGLTGLVAYQGANGLIFLTRQSVDAIATKMDEVRRYNKEADAIMIDATDTLVQATPRGQQISVSKSSRITNFKGDEIDVWAVPGTWVTPEIDFTPKVPFILDGETCSSARFAVLDEQYGLAPWSNVPSAPKP